MMKAVSLILVVFLVSFVNATSCWGPQVNCTAHTKLHQRTTNGPMTYNRGLWPRGKIEYCFASPEVKSQLKVHVTEAIRIWMHSLGPAGPGNHGLTIEETSVRSEGRKTFCYLPDYQSMEQPGTLSPEVSSRALKIHLINNPSSGATVGYSDGSDGQDNSLMTGLRPALAVFLVHEFAHVFGLGHEHQRSDRDQHIRFNCEKLEVFDATLQKAMHDHPSMSRDEAKRHLCSESSFAYDSGFDMFYKNFILLDAAESVGSYDFDSITHYPSNAGAVVACKPNRPSECPLLDRNGNWIPLRRRPSQGDVRTLKAWYPYVA